MHGHLGMAERGSRTGLLTSIRLGFCSGRARSGAAVGLRGPRASRAMDGRVSESGTGWGKGGVGLPMGLSWVINQEN
jgi:hypothetical protein